MNIVPTNYGIIKRTLGFMRSQFVVWLGEDISDILLMTLLIAAVLTSFILFILSKRNEKQVTVECDVHHADMDINETGPHIPFPHQRWSNDEMKLRSSSFYKEMSGRRSLRFFSDEDVPFEVIENIVRTAGTAPSGAHTEPWTYVLVRDTATKESIREIVEAEERVNYERRMSKKWKEDLAPLGTGWQKEYLTKAPYLIVALKQVYGFNEDGTKKTHYYNEISQALSCGLLLAAVQHAGLVTLTSTPMNSGPALKDLLGRPKNEKITLLLPIGISCK